MSFCNYRLTFACSLLFLLLNSFAWFSAAAAAAAAADRQCDAQQQSGGVCTNPPPGCVTAACLPAVESKADGSIYRFGGTAQAYKANAPSKPVICESEDVAKSPYRVATWPYRRASYSSNQKIPTISLSVKFMSCGEETASPSARKGAPACCCQRWGNPYKVPVLVEAWQARPDGTYGSLQPGVDQGVCRAQQQLLNAGSLEFETYAPGSYGSLGGLGPNGLDFMPFGPPVVHLLATAPGYAPTLVDVPLYFDVTTLESKAFRYNDWRGTSWMRQQPSAGDNNEAYEIVSWTNDPIRRTIDVAIHVFLQKRPSVEAATANTVKINTTATESLLCESSFYGLPSSFFREPISVCGSSFLDFFAL